MHRRGTRAALGHRLNHPEIIANIIMKKAIASMATDVPSLTMTNSEEKESAEEAAAEDDQTADTPRKEEEPSAATHAK